MNEKLRNKIRKLLLDEKLTTDERVHMLAQVLADEMAVVRSWVKRAIVGFVLLAVTCAIGIGWGVADSNEQAASIIAAQRTNCQSVEKLRDAMSIVLLRAYGSIDPAGARKLAVRVELSPSIVPSEASPGARRLDPAQKRVAAGFYTVSLVDLHEIGCVVSETT